VTETLRGIAGALKELSSRKDDGLSAFQLNDEQRKRPVLQEQPTG